MRILVFDNYDSFTYNLVDLLSKPVNGGIDVYRNDEIRLEKIKKYDKIILSPGPGIPVESGLLLDVIREYAPSKSILGVCLGHQAIGEAFGGQLINLETVFHGVAVDCIVKESGTGLFKNLPSRFPVGRYHSWVIDERKLPSALMVTAADENNYIMGIRHRNYDVQGVQFHPESILTPHGERIIKNWLEQ
jgi:anthranilate synthase component II